MPTHVNFYGQLNPLGTTPTDCFIEEWKGVKIYNISLKKMLENILTLGG